MKYIFLVFVLVLISCGGKTSGDLKIIEDLPFHTAEDAKAYADLILKAIRTDRDEPIWQEFVDKSSVNKDSLHYFVGMYSTGIRGRDDWEHIDVYGDDQKDNENEFNYAWLDQSGRLGLQIKIVPRGTSKGFDLDRLEFRSRLGVMESMAFPGGAISDYEKLDYDWESKMKRRLEEAQK